MKLAVFGLFLLALSISAIPIEEEGSEFLEKISEFGDGSNITPQQKQCIENAIKKIRDENPQLADWFAKVDKSKAKIEEKIKLCKQRPEAEQTKCLKIVRIIAKREAGRLISLLPPDQKPILGKIKAAVEQCLKQ